MGQIRSWMMRNLLNKHRWIECFRLQFLVVCFKQTSNPVQDHSVSCFVWTNTSDFQTYSRYALIKCINYYWPPFNKNNMQWNFIFQKIIFCYPQCPSLLESFCFWRCWMVHRLFTSKFRLLLLSILQSILEIYLYTDFATIFYYYS